jgi:hypothetical protein
MRWLELICREDDGLLQQRKNRGLLALSLGFCPYTLFIEATIFLDTKDFVEEEYYFAYKHFANASFGRDEVAMETFQQSIIVHMYMLFIKKGPIKWQQQEQERLNKYLGNLNHT